MLWIGLSLDYTASSPQASHLKCLTRPRNYSVLGRSRDDYTGGDSGHRKAHRRQENKIPNATLHHFPDLDKTYCFGCCAARYIKHL